MVFFQQSECLSLFFLVLQESKTMKTTLICNIFIITVHVGRPRKLFLLQHYKQKRLFHSAKK